MRLDIFDVEHGACALLTADNGARLMIDCGHNARTGWKPGNHLRWSGISFLDMLAITNYDEDHASGAPNLFDNVDVLWLARNASVSPDVIKLLKTTDGMGPGMDRLCQEIKTRFSAPSGSSPEPFFQGLREKLYFCCRYPRFEDENNLSMAVFINCHGVGVLFPGDLEEPAFQELLQDATFRQILGRTNIYVAAHHGRKSGCCDALVPYLTSVFWVVISDTVHQYETQQTSSFYTRVAKGGLFRGEFRKVLTTRTDRDIAFQFSPGSWDGI